MSMRFLKAMNGNRRGKFAEYIAQQVTEPRILWYPSAGTDFRDLLFAHPHLVASGEPPPPDLFVHTDYYPWEGSTFLDTPLLHTDSRTTVRVVHCEALPDFAGQLDPEVVHFPEGSKATGKVLFMKLEIESSVLGRFTRPLLYVFSENAAFCARRALPNHARFSHIVRVRFGGGCGGGGDSSGIWLWNALGSLGCEVFATDGHDHLQGGDRQIMRLYPELAATGSRPATTLLRTVPGRSWSEHGDVDWLSVERR